MVSPKNINTRLDRNCKRCDARFVTQIPTMHFCSLHCRFYDKADVRGLDDCWEWKKAFHNKHGYGSFTLDGRARYAHRVALGLHLGRAMERGEVACHRCDNPRCVNPSHLFLGTAKDNMSDARAKGRLAHQAKTHCAKGHLWNDETTYSYFYKGKGQRVCKQCRADSHQAQKARKIADAIAA